MKILLDDANGLVDFKDVVDFGDILTTKNRAMNYINKYVRTNMLREAVRDLAPDYEQAQVSTALSLLCESISIDEDTLVEKYEIIKHAADLLSDQEYRNMKIDFINMLLIDALELFSAGAFARQQNLLHVYNYSTKVQA